MDLVRLGIIGLGRWAEWHLDVLATMSQARVTAVCSRSLERAQEIAGRYHVPAVYADYRDLVLDAGVDAVVVATSEDRHCGPTLAALAQHKPVLVEKPIAHTLEDAEAMVAAAREADTALMPGHTLRFDTSYVAVKDLIARGELGRVASIFARRHIPRESLSFRPTPLILRTCIHDLDIILWYVGELPSEVHCMQSNNSGAPVADTNWILLRFPGGALAGVETAGLIPPAAPGRLIASMEVVGTKGLAEIDHVDQGVTLWAGERATNVDLSFRVMLAGRLVGSLRNELEYFLQCVLESKKPDVVTPQDAIDALRVCLVALRAAEDDQSHVSGPAPARQASSLVQPRD